jgi:hypothetical protein
MHPEGLSLAGGVGAEANIFREGLEGANNTNPNLRRLKSNLKRSKLNLRPK